MLQDANTVSGVNGGLQLYVAVRVACDSAFPFDAGDDYVLRVVDDAVVITPPDCSRDTLDLPRIDDDFRPTD